MHNLGATMPKERFVAVRDAAEDIAECLAEASVTLEDVRKGVLPRHSLAAKDKSNVVE